MALIPQVKCTRCDRKYSALRTRCPYCGARRRKQGSRSVSSDNSLWKFIVGALLLIVLIAAVVVLIVTSAAENKETGSKTDTKETEVTSNEGVSSVEGTKTNETSETTDPGTSTADPGTSTAEPGTTTPTEPATTTEPTPTPAVTSVTITYNGRRIQAQNKDLGIPEFTLKLTEAIVLGVKIEPSDSTATPVWEADDPEIIAVLQTGKVTGMKTGSTILRVTVDGVTDEVFVRVSR